MLNFQMFTFKNVLSPNKKLYKTCISKRCCIIHKWYEKNYKSPNYHAALKALDSFEKSWGEKYLYAIKSWKNNFDELITFIWLLNRNIRKIKKTKGAFTNTKSLYK